MRPDRLGLLAAPVLVGLLAGCQSVAGTSPRQVDPYADANVLPGLEGGPSLGDGRIRIADLAVTQGGVDFCVKLSSSSDWGDPVMASAGGDPFFHAGLNYPEVTVPLSAPVGAIDVRFIPVGSLCTATALSEGDGIPVGDAVSGSSPVVTILRYGGSSGQSGDQGIPEAVAGLPEEVADGASPAPTCPSSACPRFRVVNAAAIPVRVGFGPTVGGARGLPASVSDVLSGAIPPGGTARAQTKASPPLDRADTSGYFGAAGAASGAQLGLTLGIVECGADLCADSSKDAGASAIAVFQPSTLPDTQTLYLIGDPASTVHPVEGLLVEDDQAAGDGPDGGVDWQLLARSTLTTPATITVDTFDVELAGLTTPSDSVRSSYIASAIAAAQSDVVCVTEIPFDRDKRVIASAALPKNGGNFGYSYYLASDLTTPPTSALTWSGATPATLMTSACASSTDALRALAGCAASSCVAGGGSGIDGGAFPGSPIVSASCLEARCLNEVASLISSDPVCTDCAMLYLVSGYDVSTMYDECGSDAQDPYGQFEYAGMNGTMILSRYPFARNRVGEDDTSAYLFPGSSFRRAALRANVQLDSSTTIDVYCAELTSPPGGWSVLTYTGLYASPDAGLYADEVSDDDGWRDERSLQARDLVDWVKSQSQGAPAVLAGEWNAGLAESKGDSGTPLLAASDPEVLRRFLDAGWVPAHPADHTTACTRCNGNPYQAGAPVTADGTLGVDTTTTFLLGFPASATIYETIWDVGVGDIPAITGMDGGPFPLSPDYPRRVQILRP